MRLLTFFLAAMLLLAGQAHAAFPPFANPPGCPSGGGDKCSVPLYPNGSPYSINELVRGSDGNIYRSVVPANVANPASATECGTNWLPVMIFANKTININPGGTGQCSGLATSMAWLALANIADGATVTIHPVDGTYTLGTSAISLNHPFGRQINIIGNTTTPANVVFNFSGVTTTAAVVRGLFELSNGNGFGTINGITYNGPTNSVCTPNCQTASTGYPGSIFVYATGSGSSVTVGPNVTMAGGYAGAAGFFGAYVVADGVDCSGGGDGCIWGYGNGTVVSFIGAKLHDSATPAVFSGSGGLCDNRAYCIADGSFMYSNNFGMSLFNDAGARTNGPGGQATFGKNPAGTSLRNTNNAIQFADTSIFNVEGTPIFGPAESTCRTNITNWFQGGNSTDSGCNVQGTFVSNGNYGNIVLYNNGTTLQMEMNKSGQTLFGDTSVKTALASQGNFPLWLVANNLVTMKNRVDQSVIFPKTVYSGETTFTVSGCSATSPVGSGTTGRFTSGTTGTCTAVITLNGATGMTAANGWSCYAADRTTPADIVSQTADSTTTATLSGTTVSGDVISFGCLPY